MPILGIYSLTRSLHDLKKKVFRDVTDRQTNRQTHRRTLPIHWKTRYVFNSPIVAGAVLKTLLSFNNWLSHWSVVKLDGVGPVDNRPSNNKLHHFVQKKRRESDMWYVTRDTWHMTRDMRLVTCDMLWGVNILSKYFSSLALLVCDLWYFED